MTPSPFDKVHETIQSKGIRMINLLTLDLIGRPHTLSIPVDAFNAKTVKNGVGFDGSSYGFRKVENSDMILVPDLDTMRTDPYGDVPSLTFFTQIHLTDKERSRFTQDPRRVAQEAEALLQKEGIADQSMWGPEYEFYIFPEVDFKTSGSSAFYHLSIKEDFNYNAYHAAKPFDRYAFFRNEVTEILQSLGIQIKYHHHETGRRGQQEIETRLGPLLLKADEFVLTKYVLFNYATEKGIYVTFMPKPMYMHPGSGLHLHQYLIKAGKNAFYEEGAYGNFNQLGLYYIGGLLKHAPALAAFTNPSTNSYKRLVRGYEAPVTITFGLANRTSAVRIPSYVSDPEETRLEYRPPDATCNPYLCLSALLMAGIDGIINKIDPIKEGWGPADAKDCETSPEFALLPRDLMESLEALSNDHAFLMRNDVFPKELIDQWLKLKWQDVNAMATIPNPHEYTLYFNL
ncbi:MAG: type I glutamate--ammonia ligase [Planctomycetota bacterium]